MDGLKKQGVGGEAKKPGRKTRSQEAEEANKPQSPEAKKRASGNAKKPQSREAKKLEKPRSRKPRGRRDRKANKLRSQKTKIQKGKNFKSQHSIANCWTQSFRLHPLRLKGWELETDYACYSQLTASHEREFGLSHHAALE